MKAQTTISFIILLLAAAPRCWSEEKLTVKWGLENEEYFEEKKVPADANSAIREEPNTGKPLYRFFETNRNYERIIVDVISRHFKVWENFADKNDQTKKTADLQKSYAAYLKKQDPLTAAMVMKLAPTLYFDFIGSKGHEYVLTEIEIKTINFEEYRGGGFCDNEAWYDIELSHTPGVKKYPIGNKRLRFDGSGRCVLRFWSDNYYRNVGMTPLGCYDIDITFIFLADGQKVKVSTGRFKIDV